MVETLKPTDIFCSEQCNGCLWEKEHNAVLTDRLREIFQDHKDSCGSRFSKEYCDVCVFIKNRFGVLFTNKEVQP